MTLADSRIEEQGRQHRQSSKRINPKKDVLRVYGYVRLSRDDDREQSSLNNQKAIVGDFAADNGLSIIRTFEDDNISGMTFDRDGINELRELIYEGEVDIILVKDLSRIGRQKTQHAIFMDDCRRAGVKILSVTENVDSENENDDLIIGVKQILNEQYSKDLSRKIRAAQKQKMKEGFVINPPFGYVKNSKTKEIEINEEQAAIVREIFAMYLDGYGMRKITQTMTGKHRTPSWYAKQESGQTFQPGKAWVGGDTWSDRTIDRMLKNEAYMGVLRNGKETRSVIHKTRRYTDEAEQFIHSDFFPKIVSEETFQAAQSIRASHRDNSVRAATNHKIYRYAGLLKCSDCGATFTAKRRTYKGDEWVEYVCNGYHRFGTKVCTPHRIREADLDDMLMQRLASLRDVVQSNIKHYDHLVKEWNSRRRDYTGTITKIQNQINQLREEVKEYIRQKARKQIDESIFDELTRDTQSQIHMLEAQAETLNEVKLINSGARLGIQNSLDMLDAIINQGKITDTQIRTVIGKIKITEGSDGIELEVDLSVPLRDQVTLAEKSRLRHQFTY